MRAFRRAVVALAVGALGGVVLRFKGSHGAPGAGGRWRELTGDEFR